MDAFDLRADNIELEGKIVFAWVEPAILGFESPGKWHLGVELPNGHPHLKTADGKINVFNWLECQVTPVSPYRLQPHADRLISELVGQHVRIDGSWGDAKESGETLSTLLWPISWILVDRGLTPFVEEHGFAQVVRDADLFAFSDDSDASAGPTPAHHREDRHVEVDIPFPFRPQTDSTPKFTECSDREDAEQVLYQFRPAAAPAYPIHADRQHSFSIVATRGADSLRVLIDTGASSGGKGFYYAKFTLTYDEPFAEMCNPDICLTDHGLSCQFTGESRHSYKWPEISSALSGDMLLGPAGGSGVLGRLLGALHGPQYYDHMVLFIEDDRRTVRHCTASDERIASEEYFSHLVTVDTPFFSGSKKLPIAGIRHDIVRFAWPGSITQTIGEVCVTGRNRANPQFSHATLYPDAIAAEAGARPLLRELTPAERDKRTAFHDPEAAGTAKREKKGSKRAHYSQVRLQMDPAFRSEIDPVTGRPVGWIWPILVRPNPFVAPEARAALKFVAAEAKKIAAHYRFFGYSDAAIATSAAFNAPTAGWPTIEGADWAAGTVAAVCSTFIWAAVQAANAQLAAAGRPLIELEGEVEPADLRPSAGVDGLYRYTLEERTDAAKALFQFTYDRVEREVDKLLDDLPWYADVLLSVSGASGVVDSAKALLATVVANQLCNTFAFDAPSNLGANWNNPGSGKAASPDDTMLRWDVLAPLTGAPPATSSGKINVYGNPKAIVIPDPGWRSEPIYRVRPSLGKGTLRGTVVGHLPLDPGPTPIVGATVRFGCQSRINAVDANDRVGFEFVDTKAGRYLLQAFDFIVDPLSNVGLEWRSKQADITLNDGDDLSGVVLELFPPPGLARNIFIQSHHDIVDRVVVGKDRWGHPDMNGRIGLAFDPRDNPAAPPAQQNTRLSGSWDQTTPEVGSGVHVRVIVDARLLSVTAPNGSISFDDSIICDIKIIFFDAGEGETNATIEENNIVLAVGASFSKAYNEVSNDTVPERASGTVTITNQIAALP